MTTSVKRKRSFLKTDSGRLVLSFLLAFILWFLLKMSQTYTYYETVHINYNIPDTKLLTNNPPTEIEAEFIGSGWDFLIQDLRGQNNVIQIDLANNHSQAYGSGDLVNYISNCKFAEDFGINKVNLNLIQIELESKTTKKVPINITSELPISSGFTITENLKFEPDSILISGTQNYLDDISSVSPYFDKEFKLKSTKTIVAKINNPNINMITLSTNEVKIYFEIQQLIEKSLFIPITLINAKDSIEIFPSNVKVASNVPMNLFNSISPQDYIIEADFSLKKLNAIPLRIIKSPIFSTNNTLEISSTEYIKVE